MREIKLKQITVCTIEDVLIHYRGNQSEVARRLGVNRGGLRGWINAGLHKKMLVMTNAHGKFELINHIHGIK